MRFLIFLIWILCYSKSAFGQVDKASLLKIWEDNSAADSSRINAINRICTPKFIYSNPDSTLYFSKKAYEFAKNKDLKKGMATALYYKGMASKYLANFIDAEKYLKESVEITEKIKDTLGLAKSLNCLGNVFIKQSKYVNAIESYRSSLDLFEKIKNKKGIANLHNNIGLVFYDLKDFEKALKYLKTAVEIYNKVGDEKGEGNTLINIGSIYRHKEEHKVALEYYEKGLTLKKKNNVSHGVAICLSNIGLIYQALGDSEKALIFFNQSLEIHQEVGNKKEIANCYMYKGAIQKNLTIPLTLEAYKIAKETGNFAELAKASEILSYEYELKGEYKKSIDFFKIAQITKDSIYGLKTQHAILKNEFKYQEEKKKFAEQIKYEKEIRKAELKSQRERFLLLGILSFAMTYFFFFTKKKKHQNSLNQQHLKNKIESLKGKLATQSTILVEKRRELALDKEKIEKAINSKLGESSWVILNILFQDPAISNKEIANKVSLSLEGVSSSLRRMYAAFGLQSGNKKVALIMKAIRISLEE